MASHESDNETGYCVDLESTFVSLKTVGHEIMKRLGTAGVDLESV